MKLQWAVALIAVAAWPAAAARAQHCPAAERTEREALFESGRSASTAFYYEAEGDWIVGDAEEGVVFIELDSQGPIRFPLDAGYRLQAEKRTRLSGVPDPRLDDLQRGDRVWVKFNSQDGRVVRMKLKRPRS